jgi:hypothetical protein
MHAPLEETNPSLSTIDPSKGKITHALFAWLISHQPAVLFSPNKSATSISKQYCSLRTNQHQPPAKRTGCKFGKKAPHSPDEKKFENKKHIDHTT